MFQIIDKQTGLVVGKPYSSRSRARARADKLDNEYGAYRYYVRSATTGAVAAPSQPATKEQ